VITEAHAEGLRTRYRAEGLVTEAADRIHALVGEGRLEGFGSVVLDYDDHSLTVYWKGPLPEQMEDLLHELRRQVAIDVREARYSSDELSEDVHRINRLDLPGLALTSVGPTRDCSGLRVTVGVRDDLARASREIQSRMRLELGVEPPGQWIPAGHHPRARLVPRASQASLLYGAGVELADLVTRCRPRRRDSPLGR
jgi:hypothetical protein